MWIKCRVSRCNNCLLSTSVCHLCSSLHPLVFIIHISLYGFDRYTGWSFLWLFLLSMDRYIDKNIFLSLYFYFYYQIIIEIRRKKSNHVYIRYIHDKKKKMIDDQLITKIIEVTLYAESPCISCKKESKEELFLILADLRIYILIFQRIFLIPPGLSRLFRSFLYLSLFLSIFFSFSSFSICESVVCFYFLVERTQGCN